MVDMDGHHDLSDFEDIPPVPPTPESLADMGHVANIVDLLREYDYPFTEEPGWETRQPTYHWYSGGPFGVMVHHTATSSYAAKSAYPKPEGNRTDGRVICNALVQPDGLINLIAAGPANYSSGLNQKALLDDYVLPSVRFHGPQSGPLGAEWYGNRAWINIEVVHPGDGSWLPEEQEQSLIGLIAMICYTFDWNERQVVGHYDGRGTKVDPRWSGEYGDQPYSIAKIQDRVGEILSTGTVPPGGDMFTHFKIGDQRAEWEPVVWFLFGIEGGVIDGNGNSSQVQSKLPWKTNVRLVEQKDFDLIGDLLNLNGHERQRMTDSGIYRFGKEVAALEQKAYGS